MPAVSHSRARSGSRSPASTREAEVEQNDRDVTEPISRLAEVTKLVAAVRAKCSLTPTEELVLLSFVCGLGRGALQDGRAISPATYKTHVSRICQKTHYASFRDLRDDILRRFFEIEGQ